MPLQRHCKVILKGLKGKKDSSFI
ncbi:uncharacterized protein FRV6_11764 [Fusarium oxysporum]|uniref:Uncharacterized protein n=1 Tax=Fusarium oxysporum TaxID=5507 RepID=A0A2H3TGA4_FUSOX|nr:uncharacterized protein FRV6_11764 [Fusarium oxysporum]